MNRRGFLGIMLGVAAAELAPSQVWPFRKIFLPPAPQLITPRVITPMELHDQLDKITAVQLEKFANEIPELMLAKHPLYQHFKRRGSIWIDGTSFEMR